MLNSMPDANTRCREDAVFDSLSVDSNEANGKAEFEHQMLARDYRRASMASEIKYTHSAKYQLG